MANLCAKRHRHWKDLEKHDTCIVPPTTKLPQGQSGLGPLETLRKRSPPVSHNTKPLAMLFSITGSELAF